MLSLSAARMSSEMNDWAVEYWRKIQHYNKDISIGGEYIMKYIINIIRIFFLALFLFLLVNGKVMLWLILFGDRKSVV